MKFQFTFLLSFFALSLLSQEKGVSPLTPSHSLAVSHSVTRAVVVGISDYQDEGIPDLRFADKDAEAFANFLRSPAGGSLDDDHLKLLTNGQATTAQFDAALTWLVEESKEGDQAIIYFSGHGDVELITRSQQGFLLCWDSPSKGYVAGAYPVFFMKEIIATLSLDNKAKVLVVTDACRSGKLAGNAIGGSQLTSQNLATQYANEIKILSCQPNEYSIEGEQWGGGRGAFSYHLIDGLVGMADGNNDQSVNLMEISRYLEDHVTAEVAPQSQVPMAIGNRTEKIASVFPELLAQIKEGKKGQMAVFTATNSRGIEEDILATVDVNTRELYELFKESLKTKEFLQPLDSSASADQCADAYYRSLIAEPKLERLHAAMRRNYAAALQDEAQQALNRILNSDVSEIGLSKANKTKKYQAYPAYLQRASELLGEDHYMYPILQARKLYFEGYLLHHDDQTPDREMGEKAIAKYRAAIALQPDFPHPYFSMAETMFWQMLELDSAEYYTKLAVERAPTWFLPYTMLSNHYGNTGNSKHREKRDYYLQLADQVDSTASQENLWHIYKRGMAYGSTPEAEKEFKRAIALDSTFAKGYHGLGGVYSGKGRYAEAEKYYKKAIALDSTDMWPVYMLGSVYMNTAHYDKAEIWLKKALRIDPVNLRALAMLGAAYSMTGRFVEADSIHDRIFQLDSTTINLYHNIGTTYARSGRFLKALEIFQKGLQFYPENEGFLSQVGMSYMNLGRYDEAEKTLLKALELYPSELSAIIRLGLVYILSGRYDKFDEFSRKHTPLNSNNPLLEFEWGWSYARAGRYEEAEEIIKRAFELDSTSVKANHLLGAVYYRSGRYEKGEQQYLKALTIDSLDIGVNADLGLAYVRMGRYEEAAQQLNKTLKIDSSNISVPYVLGLLYIRTQRYAEADTQLQQLLSREKGKSYYKKRVPLLYAMLYSEQNQIDKAFASLEQAFKAGLVYWEDIINLSTEPELAPLRAQTERWDALIKKYCPYLINN